MDQQQEGCYHVITVSVEKSFLIPANEKNIADVAERMRAEKDFWKRFNALENHAALFNQYRITDSCFHDIGVDDFEGLDGVSGALLSHDEKIALQNFVDECEKETREEPDSDEAWLNEELSAIQRFRESIDVRL